MLVNIIQNTISSFRSALAAASVITTNLKMWLGFETSETLGREEVVNGDFATDSDWSEGAGWDIDVVNNKATCDGTQTANSNLSQVVYTPGKVYKTIITVDSVDAGSLGIFTGTPNSQLTITEADTYTIITEASTSDTIYIQANEFFRGSITNVSVKLLTQITPDKSGNNNVGQLFTGKALEFDGSTTYVSANSFAGTLSNNTAFTFAIWFNSNKIATDYFRNILISSGGPQQFTNIFKIGVNPQTIATGSANVGGIYFDDSAGAYNNVVPLSGGVNYNDGEWHRLVVSRPQGSGNQTLTFYVDGSSIGTAPCNPYWNNVNLFDFGQEWDGGGTSDHFAGMMSNIQVYDYAWTTDDVTYDYANPNKLAIDNPSTSLSVTNLKAYWALSEGDGLVAYDSGTNLEEDVVINGDFATDSVWGRGAGWTITNGKARNDGTAGNNNLSQGGLLEVGKSYQITIEVSDFVSGEVEVSAGGSPRGTMTANGTYTFNQVASGTVFYIIAKTFNGSVDNVSVREVTASDHGALLFGVDHVDAQPRIPQLGMMNWSKGSNLVTHSEDFTDNSWTKLGAGTGDAAIVTSNFATSPIGTQNATRLQCDLNSGTTTADQSLIYDLDSSNTSQCISIYMKSNNGSNQNIYFTNTFTGDDRDNAIVTTDWQRFEFKHTTSNHTFSLGLRGGTGSDDTADILIWGAQSENSSSASAYRLTDGAATLNSTVIANPTIPTQDIFGNAVRDRLNSFNLDGSGYSSVANSSTLQFGTSAFTIQAWIKPFSLAANNRILTKGVTGNGEFMISIGGDNASARVFAKDSSGNSLDTSNDFSSLTINSWQMITVIIDTPNDQILFFKNDGNVETKTGASWTGNFNSTQPITIGNTSSVSAGQFFDGLVSDALVYDRALTSDEVENNYNAGLSAHTN